MTTVEVKALEDKKCPTKYIVTVVEHRAAVDVIYGPNQDWAEDEARRRYDQGRYAKDLQDGVEIQGIDVYSVED